VKSIGLTSPLTAAYVALVAFTSRTTSRGVRRNGSIACEQMSTQ
jgi:hypothetical protein